MYPKLYRHFDANDTLLYVGATSSFISRMRGHKSASHWYNQIAKITIENFSTYGELHEAERLAIENENPLYNIKHKRVVTGE